MQKNGDWLLRRRIGKRAIDIVPPKLHSQRANCGIRNEIGYAGDLDVKCANREIGITACRRDESLKSK